MVAKDLAIKARRDRVPAIRGARVRAPSQRVQEVEANLIVEILDRDFDENCGNRIERMQATIYNRRFYLTAAPFGRGVNELVGIAQWKHGIRKHRWRTHCWSPRTPVL
jgi:hypothetical protein